VDRYLENITEDEFRAEFPAGMLVTTGRAMLWGCSGAIAYTLLMVVFVLAASLVVYLAGVL